MWDAQFRELAGNHRVVRYDWRGYGESDDAAGEYSHHRDLLALLDALDIEKAVLVGCSMGGAYALDVALAAPERVAGLVLICSGLSGYRWPDSLTTYVAEQVRSVVPADRLAAYDRRDGFPVRERDVQAMAGAHARFLVAGPRRDPSSVDPGVWRAALTMLEEVFRRLWSGPPATEVAADPPAADRLGEVSAPTLVVRGMADPPEMRDLSATLASTIPGAQRVDLADTGHLPPLERPAELTGALRDFLSRLPR